MLCFPTLIIDSSNSTHMHHPIVVSENMEKMFAVIVGMLLMVAFLCRSWFVRLRIKQIDPAMTMRSWPVIKMLPYLVANFHNLYDWGVEHMARGGGTFRVCVPFVEFLITSHPENLEYMLKTKFREFIKGDGFHTALQDFAGGSSILINNGEYFHYLAHTYMPVFSSPALRTFTHQTVRGLIHSQLLPRLQSASRSDTKVDLDEVISMFTFHTMAKAGLGVDPGKIEGCSNFLNAFATSIDLSVFRLALPSVVWKSMRILGFGREGKLQAALKEVDQWISKAMEERESNCMVQQQSADVVSLILETAPEMKDGSLLRDMMVNIILAGKDTVTTGLSWFFWCLCKNPHVEEKIVEELARIVRMRGELNEEDMVAEFSDEEMREMKYLHATLSEVLRLYPPIPLNFLEASNDDVLPDSTFVKKGSSLIYSIYAHGRSESVWGADAFEFKPERWFRDGKFVNRSEFKFMAFNAGPRRCLGRDVGFLLMKCVAASVVFNFEMTLAPYPPVAPKLSLSLGMKNGLPVFIKRRGGLPLLPSE